MKLNLMILAVALILFASCSNRERQIEKEASILSDSMYYAEIKMFDITTDSLCIKTRDTQFSFLVDSLIQVRKTEIQEINKNLQ
ncbi:MAG TPA: hypothetical protein PKD32_09130 [Saprospiraceae bacterium]|nr:hypothetical protein [Saprospiraceae bacterium]